MAIIRNQMLAPFKTGVTTSEFGAECANDCFFNGNGVYFHTVGDASAYSGEYTANGGWSTSHQPLCKKVEAGSGH